MRSENVANGLAKARWPLFAALLAGVSYPALAGAQTVNPSTTTPVSTASTSDATNIEEVTVTARKTTERLLDVPVAATALNRAMLERYQTTDMRTFATQVANLTLTPGSSGSGATLGIRGIASSSTDEGVSQEVTVNIDGVPISRGRVILSSMFDNSSVEVLKGPQSLFFGKNSPAGVVSLNSTDPGTSFSGYARVGYDIKPADMPYIEAALTVPVNDTFSMRFAIQASKQNGGFVHDVAGPIPLTQPQYLPRLLIQYGIPLPGTYRTMFPGEQSYFGRFTALWRPNDKLRVDFKFLDGDYSNYGPSQNAVIWSCTPGQTHLRSSDTLQAATSDQKYLVDPYSTCDPSKRQNSFGSLPAATANFRGGNGGVPFMHTPMMLGSLTVAYTVIPDVTLTSVTGYYRHDETQLSNYGYGTQVVAFGGPQDEHYRQFDEELQLVTSFHSPVNFTGGFYYEKEDDAFDQNGGIGYEGPDAVTGNWADYSGYDIHHSTTYSVFGALDWKFADGWELNGGARYTREDKAGIIRSTYVNSHLTVIALSPTSPNNPITGTFTNTNVSPQVTLSWHVTPQVMLYAAYRTGYKSGGWAGPGIIPPNATSTNERYAPETSSGEEAGVKWSLGSFTGDLTVYDYTFKGLQLTAFNTVTSTFFTENAGAATTRGVELNANWQVEDELSLHGSVAYNQARYSSFPAAQCWADQSPAQGCIGAKANQNPNLANRALAPYSGGTQDMKGMPVAQAPDWQAIVGFTYDHPLFGDWKLGLTSDIRFKSGYFLAISDNPYAYEKPYATVDATLRIYNHNWEAALIGRNITNTLYALSGGDIPLGTVGEESALLGNPREILFQLGYKF